MLTKKNFDFRLQCEAWSFMRKVNEIDGAIACLPTKDPKHTVTVLLDEAKLSNTFGDAG